VTPQFDFLGVPVSDMARSVAFYRLLGLDFPEGAENEAHVEAPLPGGMRYALVCAGLAFGWLTWTLWVAAAMSVLAVVVRTSQVAREERA